MASVMTPEDALEICVKELEKTGSDYTVFDPPTQGEGLVNRMMKFFLRLHLSRWTWGIWNVWIKPAHFDRLEKFKKKRAIAAVWESVAANGKPEPLDDSSLEEKVKRIQQLVDETTHDEELRNSISYFKKHYEDGTMTPTDTANALLDILEDEKQEHCALGAMQWESARMRNDELKDIRRQRVMNAARDSTDRYKNKNARALEGILFVVKDEFWTKDYPVTMGTKSFDRYNDEKSDATFIENLIAKGAILCGKGEMHQLGMSLFGINYRTVVRNPRDRTKLPGGSSSGVAAVVGAKYGISFGVGSDGGGSIRCPASLCSLWGWMPSHSTFIGDHGPDLCPATDHIGPLAGSLIDAGRMYLAMHQEETTSLPQPEPLDAEKYVVGIERGWLGGSKQLDAIQQKLESSGKFIFCDVKIPGLPEARAAHLYSIYGEMWKFVEKNAEDIPLTDLLDTTRLSLMIGRVLSDPKKINDSEKMRTVFTEIMRRAYNGDYNDEACKNRRIDFLLMPTLDLEELPAIVDNFNDIKEDDVNALDKHLGGDQKQQKDRVMKKVAQIVRYLNIWNLVDVSAISMPVLMEGKPCGLQVIAANDFKAYDGAKAIFEAGGDGGGCVF